MQFVFVVSVFSFIDAILGNISNNVYCLRSDEKLASVDLYITRTPPSRVTGHLMTVKEQE